VEAIIKLLVLTLFAAALPSVSLARALPAGTEAMIVTAAQSKDPAVLAAVVSVARKANPDSGAELDALLAQVSHMGKTVKILAKPAAPKAPPPAPVGWKGALELGGALATGPHDVAGGYASIDLTRSSLRWKHRFTARGDYQETDSNRSTDRFSLAYEPRVTLSDTAYGVGIAQIEHDKILGLESRYTLGAGLGLRLPDDAPVKLTVDIGPAVRLTNRVGQPQETAVSARGSLNLRWLQSERLTVSEESAIYTDREQTSARSSTALDTLLYGPLKARLSYNLQYERNPLSGFSGLSSTTRASLLYSF
jgi:putative salt-induced outer membrane protein